MFEGRLHGVPRVFKGCFKEISRMIKGCFKHVSRKFQDVFEEYLKDVELVFMAFSRKFQGHFKLFPECFIDVSKKGVVLSYHIKFILPSIVKTDLRMYSSRCKMQFSIKRHT